MGIDAEIQIQADAATRFGIEKLLRPWTIRDEQSDPHVDLIGDADFMVDVPLRHRDLEYGPFDLNAFTIFYALYLCLVQNGVRVWYGGDCGQIPMEEVTKEQVVTAVRKTLEQGPSFLSAIQGILR